MVGEWQTFEAVNNSKQWVKSLIECESTYNGYTYTLVS